MKYVLLTLLALGMFACNERIVQLPETQDRSITEVLDVSPAYVFYNEEKDSAEFNRKNLISTTNWLVNVDKRLTLKQAMPHIKFLQDKRKKASMHKNEEARNFFSCSNPDIQNLAFIDFTDLEYEEDKSMATDSIGPNLHLVVHAIDDIDIVSSNKTNVRVVMGTVRDTLESLAINLKGVHALLYLNLDSNLTFQDYISIKSELLKLDNDLIPISRTEFIFN